MGDDNTVILCYILKREVEEKGESRDKNTIFSSFIIIYQSKVYKTVRFVQVDHLMTKNPKYLTIRGGITSSL